MLENSHSRHKNIQPGANAMKSRSAITFSLLSVFLFVLGSASMVSALELVRAKIGVEIYSGGKTFPAKSKSRLKVGDAFRIYVMPENDCYVYVISSDKKSATLLNPEDSHRVSKGSLKFFPSMQNRFQPDGLVTDEYLTVICSPKKLNTVTRLFSSGSTSFDQWASLEKELVSTSRISLNEKTTKPVPVAGNVRGHNAPFVEQMRTSSGNSLLVKRYHFHVKK